MRAIWMLQIKFSDKTDLKVIGFDNKNIDINTYLSILLPLLLFFSKIAVWEKVKLIKFIYILCMTIYT